MKKILIVMLSLCLFTAVKADEGMWMPQQLPQVAKELKAAGLKLDPTTLTKLTEFPMGAIVSLGGCSASFVSPQGLVATNHHCVYNSVAVNSTKERDLLANGFLAKTFAEELPAAPGSRIFVTSAVTNVSDKIITADVAKLQSESESNKAALLRETQRLLRLAGVSELYCKQRRDAIIIWCIQNGRDLPATDDELYRMGEDTLVPKD